MDGNRPCRVGRLIAVDGCPEVLPPQGLEEDQVLVPPVLLFNLTSPGGYTSPIR